MTEKIGKYEVHEKIGVGGFGEVYKGYDPFIKRHVAIKTCSSSDQDIRSRFFQEAEIAGNLHHRNITTVYDFGIHDELPYLIQEYLSGEDLDRKVKRRDYLPFAEKLYYLLQISRGLGHAHSKGVIHRDIKPANIRILEDGTAKIMDFGIAKLAQQETGLTQTGMTLGTAAYLAPEQIRGEDVHLSTDVFAFGIMAYELLVFERPFKGKQISVVLHQILDREPPPVSEKWPAAPPEIVAFIDCCLHKDPTRRYADGSELLRTLERIQKRGRGAAEPQDVDDRPTVQLPDRGPAAARPSSPAAPPVAPSAARAMAAVPGAEAAPTAVTDTAAGGDRRKPPTIDDIEFSLSGDVEAPPVAAAAPAPSGRGAKAVFLPLLALLAVAAVGGGWWLGTRDGGFGEFLRLAKGGPGEQIPEPMVEDVPATGIADPEVEAGPAGGGSPEGDPAAGDPAAGDAAEDAGTGDPTPPEVEGPVAAGPGEETSAPPLAPPPESPPPPAPPARGTVAIAKVEWTDRMTVRIGGKTYPLHRGWEVSLRPGTYEAVFETKLAGYPKQRQLMVTVEPGKTKALSSPIPRPGALSVRPLPRRPHGVVWVDGKRLQQSPIRGVRMEPGGYRIEIRPVTGGGNPLAESFTIEPGQETVLSFDLDQEKLSQSIKPLG